VSGDARRGRQVRPEGHRGPAGDPDRPGGFAARLRHPAALVRSGGVGAAAVGNHRVACHPGEGARNRRAGCPVAADSGHHVSCRRRPGHPRSAIAARLRVAGHHAGRSR